MNGVENSAKSVSVVIPVRNEAAKIGRCVESILSQSVPVHEIVIVDSGSTDGTLEILNGFDRTRVICIESASFNHGHARNVGVRAATTNWVALTVGDAYADRLWVQRLFEGVVDRAVVAVCGSQIVPQRPDSNPVEWFSPVSAPEIRRLQFSSAAEFDALTPAQKSVACAWDDVSALYRRDVLLRIPFENVMYGEDAIWAKTALRNGCALTYNPAARVNHYHEESAEFTFRRTIVALCLRYQNFGFVQDEPSVASAMTRVLMRLLTESDLTWQERVKWLKYNFRTQRSSKSAFQAFNESLRRGRVEADSFCREHGTTPPVPVKNAPDFAVSR